MMLHSARRAARAMSRQAVLAAFCLVPLSLGLCGCSPGDVSGGQDEFGLIATVPSVPTSHGTMSDFSVGFADEERGWLAVHETQLYRTVDGGHSWQPASGKVSGSASGVAVLPKDIGGVARLSDVHCLGKDTIWVTYAAASPERPKVPEPRPMEWEGVDVLLVSRDGGRSWSYCESLHLDGMQVADTSWEGEQRGWVLAVESGEDSYREYVFETKDGGRSWKRYPVTEACQQTYGDLQTTTAPSPKDGFPWRHSTRDRGTMEIDWNVDGRRLWGVESYEPEYGPIDGEIAWSDDFLRDGYWQSHSEHHHLFAGIFFADEAHGWIDADNGIWGTTDAGENWGLVQKLPWGDVSEWSGGSFVLAGDTVLLVRGDRDRPDPPVVEVWARPAPAEDK